MHNATFKIVLVSLLWLLSVPVAAQRFYHQLGATAAGGWSSQVTSADGFSLSRGNHVSAGFCYEMQYAHLLFQTGAAFQWRSAGVAVKDGSFFYPEYGMPSELLYDSQNEPFRMNIIVTKRTDMVRTGDIVIPALVGGLFGQFYCMAGLKFVVPMFNYTSVRAHVTTQGYYDRYVAPVTSAAMHGFVDDYPSRMNSHVATFSPRWMTPVDLLASAELGYSFSTMENMVHDGVRTTRETRFRVALYADYSVLPLHHNQYDLPFVIEDRLYPFDVDRYVPTHALGTVWGENSYLANLNLGIRVTVLIGSRQQFLCLSCDSDGNNHFGLGGGFNRQTDKSSRPSRFRSTRKGF